MSVKKFAPNDWFKDSTGRTIHDISVQVGFKTQKITVSTSATPIPDAALANRQFIRIQNISGVTIYIGGSDVTITNGWQVLPYGNETFAIEDTAILYGCVASSTADCICMEGL